MFLSIKSISFSFIILLVVACGREEFGHSLDSVVPPSTNNFLDQNNGSKSPDNQRRVNIGIETNGSKAPLYGASSPFPIQKVYAAFENNENFVYSPNEIRRILSGLYLIASENNRTQIRSFEGEPEGLFFQNPNNFAALWMDEGIQVEQGIVNDFSKLNFSVHKISNANADRRIRMNNIIREKTKGYLSELFQPLEKSNGDFDIASASFFLNQFKNAFDPQQTYEGVFHGVQTHPQPFLAQKNVFATHTTPLMDSVAITLEEGNVLLLLQPYEDLAALEKQIEDSFIADLWGEMKPTLIELHVPKMDFISTFNTSMFRDLLSLEPRFGFSMLSPNAELGRVVHQVRWILNEDGVSVETPKSESTAVVVHRFDKPFAFVVFNLDESKILCLGRYAE